MTEKQQTLRKLMELKGLQAKAGRMQTPFGKAQVAQEAIPIAIDIIEALAKEVFKEEYQKHA